MPNCGPSGVTHLADRTRTRDRVALGMLGEYPDLGIPLRGGHVMGDVRVRAARFACTGRAQARDMLRDMPRGGIRSSG
jgi:hypothetical protein